MKYSFSSLSLEDHGSISKGRFYRERGDDDHADVVFLPLCSIFAASS